MTTIIGIQGGNFALLCVDSRVSDMGDSGLATQIYTLKESSSKIATNGKYLLGAAGDVRAINILHHAFQPPPIAGSVKGRQLDHFMTVSFIPALRECFDMHGYSTPDKEDKDHTAEQGSVIVCAVNGVIYIIDGDYSWMSDASGVYSIGTGAQYALGCLTAMYPKKEITPAIAKTMALKALSIAAKFDPYTGFPYHTFIQESGLKKTK